MSGVSHGTEPLGRPLVLERRHAKHRLGWAMLGLAPVALAGAAAVAVFSGILTASAREVFIARLLDAAAAALFASGYALIMCAGLRPTDHALVTALRSIAVGAVIAAALITAGRLLFVNDTVAAGIRVSLWVLVGTAAAAADALAYKQVGEPVKARCARLIRDG